jgi:hypothetical protein
MIAKYTSDRQCTAGATNVVTEQSNSIHTSYMLLLHARVYTVYLTGVFTVG